MGIYSVYNPHQNKLCHSGVKGMVKGVRRYQNKDGTWTELGKERRRKDVDWHKVSKAVGVSLGLTAAILVGLKVATVAPALGATYAVGKAAAIKLANSVLAGAGAGLGVGGFSGSLTKIIGFGKNMVNGAMQSGANYDFDMNRQAHDIAVREHERMTNDFMNQVNFNNMMDFNNFTTFSSLGII